MHRNKFENFFKMKFLLFSHLHSAHIINLFCRIYYKAIISSNVTLLIFSVDVSKRKEKN